jgi:hypothetical protein
MPAQERIEGELFGGLVGLDLDPQVQRNAVGDGEAVRVPSREEICGEQVSVPDSVTADIVSEVAEGVAGEAEPVEEGAPFVLNGVDAV